MSHTQKRAYERYGLILNSEEFKEIKRQITEGEAEKIQKKSKNIGIYICTLNETKLIVVYNKLKKFCITALPWAFLEYIRK